VFNTLEHHIPLDVSGRLQRTPDTVDVDAPGEDTSSVGAPENVADQPPAAPAADSSAPEGNPPAPATPLPEKHKQQLPFKPPKSTQPDPKKKKDKKKDTKAKKHAKKRARDSSSEGSSDSDTAVGRVIRTPGTP
jgi:hypothetical protein